MIITFYKIIDNRKQRDNRENFLCNTDRLRDLEDPFLHRRPSLRSPPVIGRQN